MGPTSSRETIHHHWATEAGAKVASRRAERLAARQSEAKAEDGRRQLPAALFAQRFAATAALVVEAVDAFGRAAEIPIDPAPPSALSVELKTGGGALWLQREDDTLLVTFRSHSRSEQTHVDLAGEDFSPEATARRIAEQWMRQIAAAEEGPRHVDTR